MKSFLFAAVSVFALLAACNGGKHAAVVSKMAAVDPAELSGDWQLDYLSNATTNLDSLYPAGKPRIRFEVTATAVSGYSGCNNFSGPVKIDGSHISFNQPFTITKKFCPGAGETVFMESLIKASTWAMTDTSTLHLIMTDKTRMKFTKLP